MKENIYLLYSEVKQPDNPKNLNGQTVQCDGLKELIYTLSEYLTEGRQNVQINTVINGKPQ